MPATPEPFAPGYVRLGPAAADGAVPCGGPDGRPYVLRPVPADCLHGDGLNPAIRDRLARIRELPHPRVATLANVVRGADGTAYAAWADVGGDPLAAVPAERLPAVTRSLASAVELLHARGIVHGNLTADTVRVTPAGDVWLTDVSPYLWDDPAVDVAAVAELLACRSPVPDVAGLPPGDALRVLADAGSRTPADDPPPPPPRRRSRGAAAALVAVVLLAAAAAWAVDRLTRPAARTGEPVLPLVAPQR